jgi:serine phosphatase RsbU (regulator of sigma subunit)
LRLLFSIFFVVFFASTSNLFAQKAKIDSLVRMLSTADDTTKIKLLIDLCWAYRNSDIDSAIIYGNFALINAKKQKIESYYPKNYTYLGVLHRNKGHYTKALTYFFEAVKYSEKSDSREQLGYAFQSIGDINNRQGNYEAAIHYIKKGIVEFQKLNDIRGLAYCYYTIAQVYANQEDYPLALEMHNKALDIRRHIKDKGNIASSLGHIATILFLQKKSSEAQIAAVQAKNLFKESNDLRGVANMFNLLAKIEIEAKNYDIAIPHAQEALTIAQKSGNIEYMKNAYKNLFLAHQGKKNSEKAFAYQVLFIQYEDSVFSQERSRQAIDLQSKYEQEKQDVEIALLKSEQETRKYLNYAVSVVVVIVVVFLVLGFRNIRIRRKNHLQLVEQQEEIKSKNDQLSLALTEIQKKNDDINNGITYAKRIQGALLLPEEQLKKYLPQSFIIFKPRDVVSGDFYWFAEKNQVATQNKSKNFATETIILAVADCTGHGVPGAFMSMIGDSLLNQIVHDQEIHRPDLILNTLNKGIRLALHQEETEQNDGMDISIVALHRNSQQEVVGVDFAAAMNPAYIVQEVDNKPDLLILSADKKPIGGASHLYKRKNVDLHNEASFVKHTVMIKNKQETDTQEQLLANISDSLASTTHTDILHVVNTPCMLYLCSDGVQDQFGGAENKKFMLGKLKKMFVEQATKPIEEQKITIENIFESWKGKYKQTDDVCMIGIKIG